MTIYTLRDIRKYIESKFMIDEPKTGAYVPFKLNTVQNKFLDELISDYGDVSILKIYLREMILKARQEGFSSIILAIFAAVNTLVNVPCRFLEISYKEDATKQHFRRYKNFMFSCLSRDPKEWNNDLQKEMFSTITEGSEIVSKFNGSSFYVGTANTRTGERGGTVQGCLFSEEAHYPNTGIIRASEILDGTSSMVAVNHGMIFRETTANGFNHFRNSWNMATTGELNYRPRFYGWKEHYTQAQFEQIKLGFSDKSLIPQEYPETANEAFLSSGRPVFNQSKLKQMESLCDNPLFIGDLIDDKEKIEFVPNKKGYLKIWEMFKENKNYLISADVAGGIPESMDFKQQVNDSRAWSVATVFDRSSWKVVAELRLRCDPGDFGRMLVTLGEFYNWAILIPEINNHGWATMEAMKAKEYPHILKTADIWDEGNHVTYGFPTNLKTKTLIVSALRNAIDRDLYKENSPTAINEMMGAVWNENGYMVSEGGFLDCVISRGIGLYCLKYLTLDDTYRSKQSNSPMTVQAITPKPRGKTGYR